MNTIKRVFAVLLAAAVCLAGFALAEEEKADTAHDFLGEWVADRATLTIEELDGTVCCTIHWASSATEATEWFYENCMYDEITDGLTTFETGVKTNLVYDEDGEVVSSEVVFEDGAAMFVINDEGELVWTDFKETPGENSVAFVKLEDADLTPSAEELAEDYFRVIGAVEQGTAGSSLKLAQAAAEVTAFAADHELWDPDIEALRANMLDGWESLADEERSAFDANFMSIVELIDGCLEDWDGSKAVFEDAGVTEQMEMLVFDPLNRLAWENLCAHTLTMGNDDGEPAGIDYLALVNKLNPLPEGWEDALETVHITNSVGDDVEVEKKAYEAYERLKADLEENDGIEIELDSARRSIAEQQDIMDRFIEKYGADYAAKTVATPGYSEHHTGLALDLYFRLDGKDVYYNEDMVQYPEIWEKIHAKLADYGFILRYLKDKEHITGYSYEPWHIRYVDDVEVAQEIMAQPGLTLEVWLGAVNDPELTIDYGTSALYTQEELEEAAIQIKCKFASFAGCELHALRYAGDECDSEENVKWVNELDEGKDYVQVVEFLSDFHSPVEESGAWEPDMEYTDYTWWLARAEDGGWQLLTWGY